MGLRSFVNGVFPELNQGHMFIGSPEIVKICEPGVDPDDYRAFLVAALQRAREQCLGEVSVSSSADDIPFKGEV